MYTHTMTNQQGPIDLSHVLATVEASVHSFSAHRASLKKQLLEMRGRVEHLLSLVADAGAVPSPAAVAHTKPASVAANRTGRRPGFTMSEEAKRKISIAAKKRWAAKKVTPVKEATNKNKNRKKARNVSPEVRAKLAQLAIARWAKAKKAGKNKLG